MGGVGSLPPTADVVVAGGGAIGCSVTYHLAKQHRYVVLLERSTIASGASSANPGVMSIATKQPGAALELALAAAGRAEQLSAELECDIEYEQCGVLIVAETQEEMNFLVQLVSRQRETGADVELVDGAEARRLNELLTSAALGGLYRAADAQVSPLALTMGYAAAARRMGSTIVEGCEVLAVTGPGDGFSVRTTTGTISTSVLVNCCGADAANIARMVGTEHKVYPRIGQMILLAATDDLPRTKVVTARQLLAKHHGDFNSGALSFGYTFKARHRQVILGTTNESPSEVRSLADARGAILDYARRLMPGLVDLKVVGAIKAARPFSPNGPLVGVTEVPGYFVASGHGGDGISLSAVTGEYLAAFITGGTKQDLVGFAAERRRQLQATG